MESKYKIGDIVICLPGFTNEGNQANYPTTGGAGYKENKIFEIKSITLHDDTNNVLWPTGGGCGVYENAVELYNAEPKIIEEFQIY